LGARYAAHNEAGHDAMEKGASLRNALIHNALTTPDPTPADADAALAAADAYIAWLDTR
jgi:hypothetical protein